MKVAVVFWSGTGNTEAMAEAVVSGAKESGAEVVLLGASDFNVEKMKEFDAVAFGCPAMGTEVLEECEFQPMFDSLKGELSGRKIALFGSYGWGDGEWMRTWGSECKELGAVLVCNPVIANDAPDSEAVAMCKALGAALNS